jgi:hypothetical protein
MSYNHTEQQNLNTNAFEDPQPGDYWHERFCPYFIIVNRSPVGRPMKYTVLGCYGKDSAKVENKDGTWSFDYSKSIEVDWTWISEQVRYKNIDGFVADVVRNSEKSNAVVKEWKQFHAQRLLKELKELGPEVSQMILQAEW